MGDMAVTRQTYGSREAMPFRYRIYGLDLCANQPIPGLAALPDGQVAEVEVWLGSMPPWKSEINKPEKECWYTSTSQGEYGEPTLRIWKLAGGGYFRLRYGDGTEFVIDRQGSRIWATWPERSTLEDTATYLLGPVLGFVLRLRGITCLHAGAIAFGDRAIALAGQAGAGKSTTTAAFARLGCAVLADDIVALSHDGQSFLVQPACPRVCLWPESVNTLYGFADALPRLTPSWDKRYLDLAETGYRFQQRPSPLAAVYILGERSPEPGAPFVSAMPVQSGLIALVANTYANRLLDRTMRAQEFALLSRLVTRVPLRRVTAHEDPAHLLKLCNVILEDFQTLAPFRGDERVCSVRG